MALIKSADNCLYVFDSHARNCFGMPDVEGSAVVLKYDNITQLELYLSSLSVELNSEIFEVLPVEFDSNDTQCIVPPNKNSRKGKRSEETESQREERLKKLEIIRQERFQKKLK